MNRNYCERCGEQRNTNGLYLAQISLKVVRVYCKQCCEAVEKEIKNEIQEPEPIYSRFEILDL